MCTRRCVYTYICMYLDIYPCMWAYMYTCKLNTIMHIRLRSTYTYVYVKICKYQGSAKFHTFVLELDGSWFTTANLNTLFQKIQVCECVREIENRSKCQRKKWACLCSREDCVCVCVCAEGAGEKERGRKGKREEKSERERAHERGRDRKRVMARKRASERASEWARETECVRERARECVRERERERTST